MSDDAAFPAEVLRLRALRFLSWLILLSGCLLISPFPFFFSCVLIQKAHLFRVHNAAGLFVDLWFLGNAALALPLIGFGFLPLWAPWFSGGNLREMAETLSAAKRRFALLFIGVLGEFLIDFLLSRFDLPPFMGAAAFGLILIFYSIRFLQKDGAEIEILKDSAQA